MTTTSSLTLAVCLVGLCTVAAGDPGGPNWSPEQPQQLLDCMNEGMTFQRTSWNKSVLNDELPHLRLYQLLWSRRPPRFNLTVFTQLTLDRMSALVHQCQTFTGPISAALYMPLVQYKAQGVTTLSTRNKARLESAAKKLATFHAEAERNHAGCQMDLMLWYEVFDSVDSLLLYPVNALRNFARMQVRTKLLAAIDVDMLISMTLSEQLVKPRILEFYEMHALKKRVTVLPAFEPTRNGPLGRALANQLSQVSKAKLQRMHDKMPASVQQFKLQVFPRGHTATNYRKWFRTKDLYPVAYKRFFEPWFITHWDVMPWFDINFKGYGKNKIVHVASMTFYNHTFWIHPEAWLVHQPHEDSRVRTLVSRQAANVHGQGMKLPKHSLYTKVTDLFAKAKKSMIKGNFEAAVDPQMMRCFKKLPWLQKPPTLKGYPVKAELLN